MKKRKFIAAVSAGIILLCGIIAVILVKTNQVKAQIPPDIEKLFKETPFYQGNRLEKVRENSYSAVNPDLLGIRNKGDAYEYWINESGRIVRITRTEDDANKGGTAAAKSNEELTAIAVDWFEKAFCKEIEKFGNEEKIKTDSDGLFTISLLAKGYDTGNSASLTLSSQGDLMAAAFIYSDLDYEDVVKEVEVTEENVVEIAKTALEKDCLDLYGEPLKINWETMSEAEKEYFVFQGKRCWDVSFTVMCDNIKGFTDFELAAEIRINADTGECMDVATNLK
jgi:predicted small secreted protein